jgi:hypothetical protein
VSFYKLAPSRRSNVIVDEVIYARDEAGEELRISVSTPADLTDEQVEKLRNQGYALVEASAPGEEQRGGTAEQQPVGADIAGQQPAVEPSPAGPQINQQVQQSNQETETR